MDEKISKDQFLELPENKKHKNGIKTCGILCYCIAALNMVLIFLLNTTVDPGTPKAFFLIDVFLMCLMGYFIGSKRSMTAAISCLAYGIINYVQFHAGYFIIFIGLAAVISIARLNSSYKQYLKQQP